MYSVESKCTILLDAETGREVRRVPIRAVPEDPMGDQTFMTSDGKILDLRKPELHDGVYRPAWWRKAGLKFG